jgi:hypothetical protein
MTKRVDEVGSVAQALLLSNFICAEFYLLGGTPFATFGSSRGRTNKKADEAGIWVSALAFWPIKISPAPPLATVKMTRSPFQVVIGLIPMFRNSPVG